MKGANEFQQASPTTQSTKIWYSKFFAFSIRDTVEPASLARELAAPKGENEIGLPVKHSFTVGFVSKSPLNSSH